MAIENTSAAKTLNSLERTTLRNCEKTIKDGMVTFREVGEALARIKDEQLFRESHSTFKAYCEEKWGFSDSRARQLIGGAKVAKRAESVTHVTVSGEAKSRVLSKLPKSEQSTAWKEAVELADGKQPTMAQLEAVVETKLDTASPGEDADSERIPEEPSSGPPRSGTETSAADYGKCPNCAGTKWTEDEDGVACAKCHHPHGEPVGEVADKTEDLAKKNRALLKSLLDKAARTVCDLHEVKPNRSKRDKIVKLIQEAGGFVW